MAEPEEDGKLLRVARRERTHLLVQVDVELADQADTRMIGRLLDGPDVPLRPGIPVTLAFEDLAPDVAIPAFVLEVDS